MGFISRVLLAALTWGGSRRGGGFGAVVAGDGRRWWETDFANPALFSPSPASLIYTRTERAQSRSCSKTQWRQLYLIQRLLRWVPKSWGDTGKGSQSCTNSSSFTPTQAARAQRSATATRTPGAALQLRTAARPNSAHVTGLPLSRRGPLNLGVLGWDGPEAVRTGGCVGCVYFPPPGGRAQVGPARWRGATPPQAVVRPAGRGGVAGRGGRAA